MEKTTLAQLSAEAYIAAKNKGFFVQKYSDADYIAAIHEELSEAFKDWNKHNGWYTEDPKPSGIYFELTDAVIRVLSFCGYKGISLKHYHFSTDRKYTQDDLCDIICKSHLVLSQSYENMLKDIYDDYSEMLLYNCIGNLFSEFIARIEKFIENTSEYDLEELIEIKLKYNSTREKKHGGNEV